MADRIRKLDERYQEYLRDESRLSGRGDTISFPETGEELVRTVRELLGQGVPITVQGSRTGIAGAAVPQGGHILSTEKLCAVGEIRRAGERGLVTAVRVEGLSFSRRFRIAWHKDKYITPLAGAFIDLCRNYEMDYPMPQYNGLY